MTVDIAKLKALAEAAKNDCGDYVALNDYGMAVPPAVILELIGRLEVSESMEGLYTSTVTVERAELEQTKRELDQLKAKLMHQEAEAGTLAERMKAAGMMTVDELLAGAPLDAFTRHAGVNSLEAFGQWLEMRRREYVTMQAKRTLDKREDDELYEWVLAHAGVFGEVHVNFKAAMSGQDKECGHASRRLA